MYFVVPNQTAILLEHHAKPKDLAHINQPINQPQHSNLWPIVLAVTPYPSLHISRTCRKETSHWRWCDGDYYGASQYGLIIR